MGNRERFLEKKVDPERLTPRQRQRASKMLSKVGRDCDDREDNIMNRMLSMK